MSIHKLTAGSGYDYLTRQVAVQDVTAKGHSSLTSYYTAQGEAPGIWVGSGIAGIDGLTAGDAVVDEQMQSLFGSGHHPLAQERREALGDNPTASQLQEATRLGTPFKVYEADVPQYQVQVARRIEDLNIAAGRDRNAPASLDERARVRTQVAREYFAREHGRDPADAREIAATIAKHSRPKTTAVAGYDLTFSPVKSVSALWAIADPPTAAKIESAHNAAVKDALNFIEREALYTRIGTNGARQVEVRGLVATTFTHRDSRAGDPDLHTHVAIANKVQTVADGKWLAIDGRPIFKATVAASETYNTALERHLAESLGVRFAERANPDPRKRPVREIVGVDESLNTRWSSRRVNIEARRAELVTTFQRDHGRPPTPVEAIQLAQTATLQTRDAKHEPRTLADQRDTWRIQAVDELGSTAAVQKMVATALAPPAGESIKVSAAWINQAAVKVINELESRRATWQVWHVRAEAQRQVRTVDVGARDVESVVNFVVDEALGTASVALSSDRDSITEPALLQRSTGSSVYHQAGSDLFTSRRVMDAETRIVAAAERTDGRRISPESVDMAILKAATKQVELNTDQAALVRQMASSGRRVQLGIAAAGTGKTTAMSVLTSAWEESGGTVVGLAPSAAAAAALRDQTGATTDTLAKLIHGINTGISAGLPASINAHTLVLIDEAGMADTLSLDTAIGFILRQGASVRLIGDDQQLAAIGAGGVLRDIDNTHGSLRLTALMRFDDPAEGAATLALREGQQEAIGYYLDHQRIDVGDLATLTDTVFDRWSTDRAAGRDSIMLAPTRELVHELNARARTARLTASGATEGPSVQLADGNYASVGDTVITRNNDRHLSVSATDWVKNGDRWQVTAIAHGRIWLRHMESSLRTSLPPVYVSKHTELGYASTVHTAQGVTADTMHGLATGAETRQQFYTMMSRGRASNHVYLVVASDGDQHNLIRPETIHPKTATNILEDILARDGSPKSATTIAREDNDPATLLGRAALRYTDALYVGAEQFIGPARTVAIEQAAEHHMSGISSEPAWPALRSHLLLIEATGQDSIRLLASAVNDRPLDGVDDRAAILDWRLDPTGLRGTHQGPLPWMPSVPAALSNDTDWGPYLLGRATQVEQLAHQVRDAATEADTPAWARQGGSRPAADILGNVAVWRAANAVPSDDRRPTGAPQLQKSAAIYQRQLNDKVAAGKVPALAEWGPLIDALHPRRDQFTGLLAQRLAAISRAGIDAGALFKKAVADGPLPDDHVAAAMWWRISRHLSPTVAADATSHDTTISADWSNLLLDTLGNDASNTVMNSPWWPTLVASVDHAVARGWAITDILDTAKTVDTDDVELAQAMIWRIAIITDPPQEDPYEYDDAPHDLEEVLSIDRATVDAGAVPEQESPSDIYHRVVFERSLLHPLEPTPTDIARDLDRAYEWDNSPTTGGRILDINQMSADYYESQFDGSWAQAHLQLRFSQDLTGDTRFRPGYAPAGWTNLVQHLRGQGVSDDEMVAAGVAKHSTNGNLIDRFRDRAMLPVISEGNVLGFVGRRNPDAGDDTKAGPKYLNTPDTIAFHKGAQLYGASDSTMTAGSVPVIVEGPMDAIAITLATAGAYIGLAPLGTSLTDEQAKQISQFDAQPIVATDGDLAGRIAAERDYWILTLHGLNPMHARFAAHEDPASILADSGPTPLRAALHEATPQANTLGNERAANIADPHERLEETARVIAARPADAWESAIARAARRLGEPVEELAADVARAGSRWNDDPRRVVNDQLAKFRNVRERAENAESATPTDRWATLARLVDHRLTDQPDWPTTAAMLQQISESGEDVGALVPQLVAAEPLNDSPAQDLRYRLVGYLPDATAATAQTPVEDDQRRGAKDQKRARISPSKRPDVGRRR